MSEHTEKKLDKNDVYNQVVEQLRSCYDPEIPVNVYDLGLIYEVVVEGDGKVFIKMTFTSPSCPASGMILSDINAKVNGVPDVTDLQVDITWDPPWSMEMMSEESKLLMGDVF